MMNALSEVFVTRFSIHFDGLVMPSIIAAISSVINLNLNLSILGVFCAFTNLRAMRSILEPYS